MAAKIVDKDKKRDLILHAAVRLFARKGFARTTINDIAMAAGTGKGTIYEYFSTKDEIIHKSFDFFVRKLEFDFENILVSASTAREKLSHILMTFAGITEQSESRELLELMFEFWAEAIKTPEAKSALMKEMNRFYRAWRKLCADLIVEGIQDGSFKPDLDPDIMATIILGVNDGIMVQWILDKTVDFPRTMKTLAETLMEGICNINSKQTEGE